MYQYRAEVLRVIDGDTLRLNVDLGCDVHVNLTVRLFGVNAPERGTPEGRDATQYVTDWLEANASDEVVDLHTTKDKREKYGRYLGDIYANGRCLAEDLVVSGHAVAVYFA